MITWIRQRIAARTENESLVLKNSAWLSAAEIGSRIARGLLAVVAARMLGASGLGAFSYAIALGGFFTFFEEAGIALFVTRAFSKRTTDRTVVLATALALKLSLLAVALGLFLGIGPLISSIPEARTLIPVIAVLYLCDSLREFFFSVTRADQRMSTESVIKLVTNALIVALGIGFMAISASPLSLALGYVIGSATGLILVLTQVRSHLVLTRASLSLPLFKEIFFAAWPFTVLAVSNVVMFNVDSILLGHFGNASQVGLYSAASRLVQIFYILPILFSTATFPIMVRKLETPEGMRYALRKSLLLMTLAALSLTVIMGLGSSLIVRLLYGAEFAPSASMLAILSLSYVPAFIGSTLNNAVFAMDQQKKFVAANLVGIIVSLGLNLLLIPSLGGVGAAISTVCALSFITAVTALKFKLRTKAA